MDLQFYEFLTILYKINKIQILVKLDKCLKG